MNEPPSIDAMFCTALELDSAQARESYLNEACGQDAQLRRQVHRLLDAHFRGGSVIDSPDHLLGVTLNQLRPEQAGTQIGPYKLLQQIGEGGMGVVWMAQQSHPVERKVALKIIKPGIDTRQVIARFEAERQALAVMDHPHIAKILDAGETDTGRPYFVLELVRGQSITQYCDEHRLTPRERLQLFIPVCQAIQHAHQKGIIHRDIKPSNVLIAPYDGKPVVKVIDFGVAKATGQQLTEATLFTEFGAVLGTLEYMSPEQAELNNQDIDTRSDIYSLGVLLYELLTGSTPLTRDRLKSAGFTEMLRIIREEEPPRPSTRLSTAKGTLPTVSQQRKTEPQQLTRIVRGELDWIVMKALDKDRSRRYETANGFAADVQRYLTDEPVQACPPSAGYRLRKFVRRNRTAITTIALIGAALALGTATSVWQAVRATQAQERAQANFETAETQRKRAERHFRSARDAVDHMTEVGQKRLSLIPHTEPVRRELLEKALEFHQAFIEEERDDPAIRQEMGRAYMHIGWIHRNMGNSSKAIDSYRQAIDVFEGLLAKFPDEPDYRNDFARGQATFGLLISSRLPEAIQALSVATTIQKELVAEYPDRLAYKTDLITSQHYYAWVLMYNSTAPDMEQAEKVLGEIQELLQKVDLKDESAEQNTDALLGDVYFNTGRLQEAEKVWRRSLVRYQQLLIDSPANPVYRSEVAHRHENLGWLLERIDRLDEAEQSYRQSVEIRERLSVEFPEVIEYSGMLYRSQSELSELLRKRGRLDESLKLYEDSLALRQGTLGPNHPKTLASMNNLAWLLATVPEAKLRDPLRALELAEKAAGHDPKNPSYLNTLGVAHYRAGEWKAAIANLEESMQLHIGGDANDWFFLAMAHWQLGEKDKARQWYDKAVDWMDKNQPQNKELGRFRDEAAELLGVKEKQVRLSSLTVVASLFQRMSRGKAGLTENAREIPPTS